MQRRRIPILDPMFDRITLLLWPRFKQIFDANIKSLRFSQPKKLGAVDLSPHYISRRYAELIASVLTLHNQSLVNIQSQQAVLLNKSLQTNAAALEINVGNPDPLGLGSGGDLMLMQDVQQLRVEMIALLDRIATSSFPKTKDQLVFFINNYDMILSIFQERHLLSDEVGKFEALLLQQRELFAEEEVKSFFPRLITFVQQVRLIHVEIITKLLLYTERLSLSVSFNPFLLDGAVVQ